MESRDGRLEETGDVKTLRMAVPVVTAERVDRLIRFQRAWLEALRRGGGGPEAISAAQRDALSQAGLAAREAGELEALARDYCGKRWAARTLERRHQHLLEKQARKELGGREAEKLERLEAELRRQDVLPALELRYGPEAIALLKAREAELLELHQALGEALRPGR